MAFVGALLPRKGVHETITAWDVLRSRRPDATLRIVGQGPLEQEVAAWAATRPEVSLEVDPPRARVHEVLRQSAVLVLLSQPQVHRGSFSDLPRTDQRIVADRWLMTSVADPE